jgi:hypothetical protein
MNKQRLLHSSIYLRSSEAFFLSLFSFSEAVSINFGYARKKLLDNMYTYIIVQPFMSYRKNTTIGNHLALLLLYQHLPYQLRRRRKTFTLSRFIIL